MSTIRAEDTENMAEIEQQWAVKAHHHAEVYGKLLSTMMPSKLKLTPVDEELHKNFREHFPDLAVAVLDEDFIKSEKEKEKWRFFCEKYKDTVKDYNFATLLRIDAAAPYSEKNTTLVPRIQFYAIEIARNKEGHNNSMFGK